MNLGKTLIVKNRDEWRNWLSKNHLTEKEIWLVHYKKDSGKWTISYDEALDEALCFGWIDSTVKKVDDEARAQRYTPRREGSPISETNKERVRRLIKLGKMTDFGLTRVKKYMDQKFVFPPDIIAEIKKDRQVWENFNNFPEYYKIIRVAFVADSRIRPEIYKRRLNYFLKMTKQNKKFGMIR
jgi:uncharacterized protein YdeI (YjbR/CyaY-like superfamily)